jgi:diguanylate cyclase (GGDEF)-like protein/PAS domain S-box-containing protein
MASWLRLRRRSLAAEVIGFVAVVCLVLIGLEGWHSWQGREQAVSEDKIETANLARSLAQHAHDTVQAADTVLIGLRERIETDGLASANLARLRQLMALRVEVLPVIHGLFVIDRDGNGIVNSVANAGSILNYADRPYFQYHRANPTRDVLIGDPVRSKSDGSWIVTVSRRLNARDGSFAGLVEATISVDFLRRFYDTFDVGPNGAIGLISTEGHVIARSPDSGASIGLDVSQGEIFQNALTQATAGSFEYRGTLDHILRLGSYRWVEGFPLLIVVSHGMDDVLADWTKDTVVHLAVGLLATAALLLLGNRIARQIGERQQVEQRYRLLADNSSDAIVSATLDGRRLYVSPAFTTLTGWSTAESMTQRWGEYIHKEDRPAALAVLHQLRSGANRITYSFRYRRKDGAYRWVEALIQAVERAAGQERQFVANLRDIDKRKAAEEEIATLNRKLAAQALTDGLTGLANRRSFDEAIEDECARMRRDRKPLSLLMIDLDRFKLYNDRYGHQQGDDCLRTVSAVIADFARRPGDLAARYGGEEIALLLPGTDERGVRLLAETLRASVEAMGLQHIDNLPMGVVTVSIGIGTVHPAEGDDDGKTLIGVADKALYRAKRADRNRVVGSELSYLADQRAVATNGKV